MCLNGIKNGMKNVHEYCVCNVSCCIVEVLATQVKEGN